MKAKFAHLSIKANVECPYHDCNIFFDLFDIDTINDDGWLRGLLLSTFGWGCKNFNKKYIEDFGEDFKCPKCGRVIEIGEISP